MRIRFYAGTDSYVNQYLLPNLPLTFSALGTSNRAVDRPRSSPAPREDAVFGHCAAGAAHLGNVAFRSGRRARWDFATNRVTEA